MANAQSVSFDDNSVDETELYPTGTDINITLTGATWITPLETTDFSFASAPAGVSITAVNDVTTTTATLTLTLTVDFDIDYIAATVTVADAATDYSGDLETDDDLAFIADVETATFGASSPATLTERNVDGNSYIHINLGGDEKFVSHGSLTTTNFTLVGFPASISLSDMITTGGTKTGVSQAVIKIDYTPGDFDTDITGSISIHPSVLVQSTSALTTTVDMTITHVEEIVEVTASSNMSEMDLDDATIQLTLTDDVTPNQAFTAADFVLNGFPANTTIGGVVRNSPTRMTLSLDYAPVNDMNAAISSASIEVKPSILTWNKPNDLSTTADISIGYTDESVSMTSSNNLSEQTLNIASLDLTLLNDFTLLKDQSLGTGGFTLNGFHTGTTVESAVSNTAGDVITINLDYTHSVDLDADITTASIDIDPSLLTFNNDDNLSTPADITIGHSIESASLSNSNDLSEQTLNTAWIELTLANDLTLLKDQILSTTGFSLNNFPTGTTIESVASNLAGDKITVNLNYNHSVDLDADITNASIDIPASALTWNVDNVIKSADFTIGHSIESVAETASSNLTEANLDNGSITLTLTNDVTTNTGSILSSHFTLTNFPNGTDIESVNSDGTVITILLSFTGEDFDNTISNAQISVLPTILTWNTSALTADISDITATPVSVDITQDSRVESQLYTAENVIEVVLTGTGFVNSGSIPSTSFTLTDAPLGVSISDIDITSATTADVSLQATLDFDVSSLLAYITIPDAEVTSNIGDLTTDYIQFLRLIESAGLSSSPVQLDESNMDGTSYIRIPLTDETFVNHALLSHLDFLPLIGFPPGVSLTGMKTSGTTLTTETEAVIFIDYTPGDFDASFSTAHVSIPADKLTQSSAVLLTSNISVLHLIESVSISANNLDEQNLDNGSITLTLTNDETTTKSGSLDVNDFIFTGLPSGTSIQGITSDATGKIITILLDFTPGVDFDTDIVGAEVTVKSSILTFSKLSPLTAIIPDIVASIESVSITASTNLDEQNLDNGTITLTLTNDETPIKAGLLDVNDFTFTNLPSGTTIESITSDGTGKIITILLAYTPGDFDNNITDALVTVLPATLTYNTGGSLSTSPYTITASTESVAITSSGNLDEQNLDKGTIVLTLTNDQTITSGAIDSIHFRFDNLPPGTSIESIGSDIGRTIITIELNFDNYFDFDDPIDNVAIAVRPSILTWNLTDSLPTSDFLIADYDETPQAFMTSSSWLREFFLDTMSMDIKFEEEVFKRNISINTTDFVIENGPTGLSVNGLTNLADSSITLELEFDGTDFDDSLTNVMIAIKNEVLVQQETDFLRTDPFTIKANIEPVISDVSITDDTAKIDDVIMATIVLSEYTEDSMYLLVPGAKIGGYPIDSMKWVSHNLYNAWFTLAEGGADYFAPDNIPVSEFQLDDFPVEGIPYNSLIDQDFDHLDANKPVVQSLTAIGQADKQIGDEVILLISAFEEDLTIEDSSVINMEYITEDWVNYDQIGGGTYTLTYTIQPDDQDVDTGKLVSRVYLRDFAGNINDTCPKIKPNSLTIDASAPSIISMTNTTGASSAIIGDTVELTIVSDGTDYHLTEDSKVNGIKPEHGLILDRSGTTYYVRYRVKEGDDPVETQGLLKARITLEDPSGNTSPTDTTIANNDILVYPEKPTATLTGNDEICYNDTAILFVNLTGTGPWDITYSDPDSSYQVFGIPTSPHTIRLSPQTNTDYKMDSVSDATGNFNNGAGMSTVVVNPLPIPVITNLDNVYAETDTTIYELIGDPAGGVFSGPGVSNPLPWNYVFKPAVSGLTEGNPHTIKYEFIDNEGCYEDTTQKVDIVEADVKYVYQKPDKWACFLDDSYTIALYNTSESNGTFTVISGTDTPGFVDSVFYEESWVSDSNWDILTLHPSSFNWGFSPYDEPHDYIILYSYFNKDGVEVQAPELRLDIEFFQDAKIISLVGTTDKVFCSSVNPLLIKGNWEGENAVFDGPGIEKSGAVTYQFDPKQANIGKNLVYYTYTATHGCVQRDSAILTVNQTPEPRLERIDSCLTSFGSDIHFINITDTTGLGPVKWSWNFGDQASGIILNNLEIYTMDTVSHNYQSLVKYTVTLSAEIIATGCTQANNSEDHYKIFEFGSTPTPILSWTTECDKGIAVPIIASTDSEDPIANYHWIIKDQSGSIVINTEGAGLDTLNFTYAERDKFNIEVALETERGCIASASDIIHLRPYFRDIVSNGPIVEDFESVAEGWSSQGQLLEDGKIHNSWKWEQAVAGQWPHSSANPSKAMYTELTPKIEEQSWVISPCYDFSGVRRPLVRLDYKSISDRNFDGAVLQYTIDDGDNWTNVGEIDDGSINWYNSFRIQDGPGGQGEGWTGPIEFVENSEWKKGLHELDPLIGRSTVQFRIAYSNKGESEISSKGFAFDNFWIGERTRIVLIEHFTNSGISGIEEKDNQINSLVGSNYTDAIDLHYHTNVDGATDQMNTDNPAPASARSLFYGIRTAPYTFMDGGVSGTMIYDYEEELLDTLDLYTRALIDPLFEINLPDSIVDWTDIKVDIKALENLAEGEYRLYVVIAEEDVNGYQNVVRDMLPSTAGISMLQSWTAGDTKSFDLSYNVGDFVLDPENLFVVAFIQDANTKLVYQAASTNTDLNMATKPVSSRPVQDYLASKDLEMLVYPNPATNQAYLVFAEALSNEVEIQLFSHTGSLVRNALLPAGTETQILDVSGLDQGVYLIRAIQKGRIIGTQRLMIMN